MKFGLDPYAVIGLTENPFAVQALSPDERGKKLLVGRDAEMNLVAQRLHRHGKITCLDGHVGVGKTSLVNVAAYNCFQAYMTGDTTQLLIPSTVSYQLKKDGNVDQFCTEVFQGVAQTLLTHRKLLQDHYETHALYLPHLDAWLNSPIVEHLTTSGATGLSFGIPGVASANLGGGGATSKQVNQSLGFAQTGFDTLIRSWLNEIFATQGNGGVICIIDNIELLETGTSARRMLEALRDKLFNVNGLRWVFCGANGVIHSLAASPRLTAFLSTPIIDVANIEVKDIGALIQARLKEFSTDASKAEDDLPIRIEDLKYLYRLVNLNLRDLLALADEFCEYCALSGKPLRTKEKKEEKFEKWLYKATTERYQAIASRVSQRAWAVLDVAMSQIFQGTFGAADYNSFSQNSTKPLGQGTGFSRLLAELTKLGLITKSFDEEKGEEDSFNRDVFSVTAKGALVHYARRKIENFSIAPGPEWMSRVHH